MDPLFNSLLQTLILKYITHLSLMIMAQNNLCVCVGGGS